MFTLSLLMKRVRRRLYEGPTTARELVREREQRESFGMRGGVREIANFMERLCKYCVTTASTTRSLLWRQASEIFANLLIVFV